MKASKFYNLLKYLAITGNIMYTLWLLYNAIDDGFNITGHIVEVVAITGLVFLLILNIVLLCIKPKNNHTF